MGRKKILNPQVKTTSLHLHVKQLEAIHALAKIKNIKVATLMRELLHEGIARALEMEVRHMKNGGGTGGSLYPPIAEKPQEHVSMLPLQEPIETPEEVLERLLDERRRYRMTELEEEIPQHSLYRELFPKVA